MRRLLNLSAAMLALAGSATLARLAKPELPKTLAAVAAVHDFGELRQGATVEHSFQLINRTSAPVTIHSVTETCSCTKVDWPKSPVPPSQSATVLIGWKTESRRGPTGEEMTVVFSVGDGPRERMGLEFRARVVPDLEYEPDRLTFDGATGSTAAVSFRPAGDSACRVSHVSATHRAFSAVLAADGGSAVVTFDPAAWDGTSANAKLTIVTTSKNEPYVWIPLWVEAKP